MARKKSKRRRGEGSGAAAKGAAVQSKATYWFLRVAPIGILVVALTVYFGAKSPQAAAAAGFTNSGGGGLPADSVSTS